MSSDRDSIQRNRRRFYDSERHVKDLIDMEGLEQKDNEGIEVPYFDFESILMATDYFSNANKLGKGGYGPVYKVIDSTTFDFSCQTKFQVMACGDFCFRVRFQVVKILL